MPEPSPNPQKPDPPAIGGASFGGAGEPNFSKDLYSSTLTAQHLQVVRSITYGLESVAISPRLGTTSVQFSDPLPTDLTESEAQIRIASKFEPCSGDLLLSFDFEGATLPLNVPVFFKRDPAAPSSSELIGAAMLGIKQSRVALPRYPSFKRSYDLRALVPDDFMAIDPGGTEALRQSGVLRSRFGSFSALTNVLAGRVGMLFQMNLDTAWRRYDLVLAVLENFAYQGLSDKFQRSVALSHAPFRVHPCQGGKAVVKIDPFSVVSSSTIIAGLIPRLKL